MQRFQTIVFLISLVIFSMGMKAQAQSSITGQNSLKLAVWEKNDPPTMMLTSSDMNAMASYVEECEAHLSESKTYKAQLNRCLTDPIPVLEWYNKPLIWAGISFLSLLLGVGLGRAIK